MIIASQKRKDNIAEYLLYMWQIEDIIRANDLDIEKVEHNVIDRYHGLTDAQREEMRQWYESLIDMMHREGVEKIGHLQINRNVLSSIVDLHQALLKDSKHARYSTEFYKALPYIVELRAKAGENKSGEIETCFNALYGMLMMRLQHKEISKSTLEALQSISRFMAVLAHDYRLNDEDKLFEHKD